MLGRHRPLHRRLVLLLEDDFRRDVAGMRHLGHQHAEHDLSDAEDRKRENEGDDVIKQAEQQQPGWQEMNWMHSLPDTRG